jgi:hypothetical protein
LRVQRGCRRTDRGTGHDIRPITVHEVLEVQVLAADGARSFVGWRRHLAHGDHAAQAEAVRAGGEHGPVGVLYGYMGMWVYGCMGIGVYGYMGIWVYGYMGIGVYGYMGIWVYGYMGIGV